MSKLDVTPEEMQILQEGKQAMAKTFAKLVAKLTKMRFEFHVYNCSTLPDVQENDAFTPIMKFKSIQHHLGQDIQVLYVQLNNRELLYYEFDVNGIQDALKELRNW
jgi:hypothetical protein